jgi:hypothetical protein
MPRSVISRRFRLEIRVLSSEALLIMFMYHVFNNLSLYRKYAVNIARGNKCVKINERVLRGKAKTSPQMLSRLVPRVVQLIGAKLVEKRKGNGRHAPSYIICLG